MNGNRALIKREKFEWYLDQATAVSSPCKKAMTDCRSFMAKLCGEPNLCYDKGARLALLSWRRDFNE